MPSAGGRLIVEADGGSRGNPGVAGYGALVREADGRLLAERAAPLGTASNNVAEYTGLIEGLRAVLDLGRADAQVLVRMDSKLVVEQMNGRWKIKHEDMRRLAGEARELAGAIEAAGGQVAYAWVPREENAAADALSNLGMDGDTVRRDHVASHTRPTVGEVRAQPTFGEVRAAVDEEQESVGEALFSTETDPTLEGSCRLIMVRHGVTDFTRSHKLDGRGGSDPALNAEGLAQAAAAAGAVKRLVERSGPTTVSVITSSLHRARQTGGAIADALGLTAEVDRDWDEQAFGDWDGQTMADLVTHSGEELLALRTDPAYARPGGESRTQLTGRVNHALSRALARGGTVVVATHRLPLMVVLSRVLGVDSNRAWSIATAPASLTAYEFWPDGGVQVAFVNDTHHLHDLA